MSRRVWFALLFLVLGSCSLRVVQLDGQTNGFDLRQSMTKGEFHRCGLHKLTTAELTALEAWLASRQGHARPSTAGVVAPLVTPPQAPGTGKVEEPAIQEMVFFNFSSRRFHCPSCASAAKCTSNCIRITLAEALARGGVPCGNCGGRCR